MNEVRVDTEKVDDIPFELRNQRHILYGRSTVRLREELLKTVKEILKGRVAAVSPVAGDRSRLGHRR